MIHKCNYCNASIHGTRETAVDSGWSFVDIRTPEIVYIKCCPQHFDELTVDIMKATKGTIKTNWSND